MNNFWWTLLEINLSLVILWLLFRLTRTFLSFGNQRLMLLFLPVLAVLPAILKYYFSVSSLQFSIVQLDPVIVGKSPATSIGVTAKTWSGENIYWFSVILAAGWLFFRVLRLLILFYSAGRKRENGLVITEIPGQDSFSFFRWIQVKHGMDPESREIVLQHEILHSRKWHSTDLLYIQCIQCFCWFNPAVYFLKNDLIAAHEFEVDQQMYKQHKTRYFEFLLAYSLGTSSPSYLLTHRFVALRPDFLGKLTLVKRIRIMKHNKKQKWAFALIIPAMAGALSLVSWVSPPDQKTPKTEQTTEVDKIAEFKGGTDALIKYIVNNVKYPESAVKSKTTGRVFVSFIVSETGKVSGAKILKSVHPDLDAEAVRVVSAMPDWDPAEKGGKKVSSEMQLPISFQL